MIESSAVFAFIYSKLITSVCIPYIIQKTHFTGMISKNVRLDVLFEGDDSWYDVEMMDSSNLFMPG